MDRPTTLKQSWFHILLALSEEPLHGYAIREAVEERTAGGVVLWPATLYGSVREMSEAGLIEEVPEAEQPDDDQRRKYYRLLPAGRERLLQEVARMEEWARLARSGAG